MRAKTELGGQGLGATAAAALDYRRFQSLRDLFEAACVTHADSVAFVQMGTGITYRKLDALTRDFAAWLQNECDLKRGDRIAIMLPNVLQYPVAMFGALRAGLVVVNTNPLYTGRELENQLRDSGAQAIVVLENFAHVLQQVIGHTDVRKVLVTAVGDMVNRPKSWIVNFIVRHRLRQVTPWSIPGAIDFKDALKEGRRYVLSPITLGHYDLAFLQYTGGTTGGPKGAMLSHLNVCANVLQCEEWLDHFFKKPSVLITPLPLYHIFALTVNCLVFLRLGWTNVLILNPRDLAGVVKEMRRYRFAFLTGVSTFFKALLQTPGISKLDFSNLRLTLAGGMALDRQVAMRWKAVTGTELTQAWGLTETSPGACINPRGAEYNGSVGLSIPCTEISVKDDSGMDVGPGERGEICVRGPQVMCGYWNRPDETAEVMLQDGWLRTGDIGHIDERGYLFVADRKKDMINVSGFNVYPYEVEAAIATHPGVVEAAAVSQEDEHSGEVVALFVVRKDSSLTAEQLIEHAKKVLTGYKVPKYVYFRSELPKTNLGKISKKVLRDQLAEGPGKLPEQYLTEHSHSSPAVSDAAIRS